MVLGPRPFSVDFMKETYANSLSALDVLGFSCINSHSD